MFHQFLYHHHFTISPVALLFPAVNPRRRYLIHNTVQENFPQLTTLSVGQGDQRRTAVTFKKNVKEDADVVVDDDKSAGSRQNPSPKSAPCGVSKPSETSESVATKQPPVHSRIFYASSSSTSSSSSVSQGATENQSQGQYKNSHGTQSASSVQQQSPPKREEKNTSERPVREGRRPEQLLYSPQRQGAQQRIDIRKEALKNQQQNQSARNNHSDQVQRFQQQQQQPPPPQGNNKQRPGNQEHHGSQQYHPVTQQKPQQHKHQQHSEPYTEEKYRTQQPQQDRGGRQQQQQQQQYQRHRKHRSRSCNSDTRSSSAQSTLETSHEPVGQDDDFVRDSGSEETQQTNSKKRRNRRNRRQKDRGPQALDQGGGGDGGGTPQPSDGVVNDVERVARSPTVTSKNNGETVHDNNTRIGSVHSSTIAGEEEKRIPNQRESVYSESEQISNSVSATFCQPTNNTKYMKSYEQLDNWRDTSSPGTDTQDITRSPVSSRKEEFRESGSASPSDTFAKHSPERMPVTVPSPSDHGNNRRRGKASAQIYRPPAARSTRDANTQVNQNQQQTVHQQQQQLQPHQPIYSQPYQPKHNFSQSQYYPHQHHTSNYHSQNYHQSQHNYSPQQQEYPNYNSLPNRQRTDSESSTATTLGDYQNKGRGRRPDQVLYVPRGRRSVPSDPASARGTPTPLLEYESNGRPPSPAYSICSTASEYSGRNRYNKQGSRQGSQISIYEGETDRLNSKPPLSRDVSRESTPNYNKQKRFSSQTLQLIERCLNQETDHRYIEYSNSESEGIHGSPSPKNNNRMTGGRALKSPTPTRDLHSVHSKENVIHPIDAAPRSRRSRKNRRRHSRSREPSADQYSNGGTNGKGNNSSHNGDYYSSPGERLGSCERIFYNSSFNSSQERYDRGYDNYDRYSSINSSRASSRNSSRERTPQYSPQHNWRTGSNPPSPTKGPTYFPNRHSPAKPPSGRLGSLPNVALEFGENSRRVSSYNEENERYHTLPIKSRTPVRSNSLQPENKNSIEYGSGCITSDRTNTNSRNDLTKHPSKLDDLTHQNNSSVSDTSNQEYTNNLINTSSNSVHNEPVKDNMSCKEEEIKSSQEEKDHDNKEVDFTEKLDHTKEDSSSDFVTSIISTNGSITKDDVLSESSNKSPDLITSGVLSEEEAYEPEEPEASLTESMKDSTEEVTSSDNDTKDNSEKMSSESTDRESRNIKKFQFNWADEVEDSWDNLYDDNGECLNPEIKRQLSDSFGKIKLEKPSNDYYSFQPKDPEINEEEYGHVIEIYDFPASFKTQDLMMVFSSFQNTGFDIKWVDDTHALGIFASALIAAEALSIDHPFLKTRSLSLATKCSKAKALRITEALLPYKPRPATSASLARRLVSGALGLKVNISREVREAEKQKLKDAKAQKRLAAKQRADAWEGTMT